MLQELNFTKLEYMAELYTTLGVYVEKIGATEKLIDILNNVKSLYKEIYGPNDKKVIKIRRQIAINLLKAEMHPEALQELLETEVPFFFFFF
jgi:hypothetical protein